MELSWRGASEEQTTNERSIEPRWRSSNVDFFNYGNPNSEMRHPADSVLAL